MNAWNTPMALEPPPTQAMTASGSRPAAGQHLLAGLDPDDPLEVADHHRERVRAHHRADAVVRAVDDVVTQSRKASLMASLSVRLPVVTGTTSAPSIRIRATFSACRRVSSSPM